MTREKTLSTSPGALLLGDPRAVLVRIVHGDPLGLRALLARRVEARHLLVDADAVHLRAIAHCARHARACEEPGRVAVWLEAQIDEGLDAWTVEEGRRAACGGGEGSSASNAGVWAELGGPLDIEPEQARRACARFNLLPAVERTAFFHLVLDRRGIEEHAREVDRPLVELAREARRALEAVLRGARPREEETP